ncbi:retrotransposon protein, putative, ty1-copia subclass, partial [Tanacetum coccineum]
TTKQEIKKIDVPSTSAAPVLTVGHNANKRKTSHSNWNGKAVKGKSDCGYMRKDVEAWRAQLSHGKQENHACDKDWKVRMKTAKQWIKKIDVPSTSVALVLTVGHNAKKIKTSHSNWKGKAAKGKSDCGSKRKAESEIAPTSDPKEAVCFYCNTKGHWNHSCPKYLKDLKDGKGLKESRMLKHGELNLVMGNRKITPVTRIGKYELMLKSRALETAAHILNLVPTKKVSKTPFEMWKGKRPYLGHIKIWGCEVYVRGETQDKLEARSKKCLFVGYPEESFGYLFYKLKDNVVFVAQRGVFIEREMISKEDSGKNKISDSTLSELDEPANYKEAMASLEAAKWKEAMKSKIQSMYDNQVQNSIDTIPDLKTVGCKWIFKKKKDMDGKVHTYKARLVAKGYTQTREIDHKETFSPVAKIKSIRIMLAIAAFHDYEIWQMDVRTAFLNGKLIVYVFMTQPKEFENEKYPKRVCKLQNAIY